MAEGALSHEALLAGLRDIRLPTEAAGGALAEGIAAAGLGLLLAAGVAQFARLVTARRRPPAPVPSPPPAADPRLALLARLKATRPERFATLAPHLYRPGGLPSLADLRRELGE